jgi:predicted ATPase
MIHLKSLNLEAAAKAGSGFPFNLPLLQATKKIEFTSPVTFFVGENGTGKSTLLEAIAAGVDSITIGGEDISRDPTLVPARALAEHIRFAWQKKTRRGFFLRAEDFFRFTHRIQNLKEELMQMEKQYEGQPETYGLKMARGMLRGQRGAITGRYGENLDANSHGESFFKLFQSRLVPSGLYLLDEPETPFSPKRQLALIVLIYDMIARDCQFIIATHSPILMAFPDAQILDFDQNPVKEAAYDELEHVTLVRSFLNNPEKILKMLINPSE